MVTERYATATAATTYADSLPHVTVQGGTLTVNVSYSGGCETHAFTLVADERFLKSLNRATTARHNQKDTRFYPVSVAVLGKRFAFWGYR